ncbi:MAG: stage II sporulation protein D [bacterium]|jgi:stage II sporulation protein D
MRKLIISLVVLSFYINPLYARSYSNPVLKVLLFKTSRAVIVRSKRKLRIRGVKLQHRKSYRVQINKVSSSKVIVNNWAVRRGSIWIRSYSPIKVRGRRYLGTIEIKPFAKGLYVINHIRTESYLEGVLNGEISTRWHPSVVQAQAVIARTFALYKRKRRRKYSWHLTAKPLDQVYLGVDIADGRGRLAIRNTYGLIVTHKGKLVPTFYHSNSGGITEDPGNIWQYSMSHLEPVKSPYGKEDPNYRWHTTITRKKLSFMLAKLGHKLHYPTSIFVSKKTSTGRAARVIIGNGSRSISILATDFRRVAGYTKVKSLLFKVSKNPRGFFIRGRGNGHGVGLSQWGAKEMADSGHSFQDILKFYYRNIQIQRAKNYLL